MLLTVDAISVLGSRHGLLLDPVRKSVRLLRFDRFEEMPRLQIRAGARIGDREVVFPFCEGPHFPFIDQRMTPCSSIFIGIDPASGVKVRLSFTTPFRPQDGEFSTTPAFAVRLEAERLKGPFRRQRATESVQDIELFFDVSGEDVVKTNADDECMSLSFVSRASYMKEGEDGTLLPVEQRTFPQMDRLIALQGRVVDDRFNRRVRLDSSEQPLTITWCTHSEPVFLMHSDLLPFRYTSRFENLDAVVAWARSNPDAIVENARRVDRIVAQNNCSNSVNHLLAFTLHSWLANTWWVRDGATDWFSVWQGSAYYLSTLDVEFTQAPFYLSVWPELLRMQLDQWAHYAKDGRKILGEIGEGTRYLSHDMGIHASAGRQGYHLEMEVEETADYLLLAFAHWRRTGDRTLIDAQNKLLVDLLWFLIRADGTGNGVPTLGVANTLADGSPAIRFGTQQVYLAIKTLAALRTGAEMLKATNHEKLANKCQAQGDLLLRTIVEKGWHKDHFGVLMEKSGRLKHPNTGEEQDFEEVPGWDAPHIYAQNALPILDMVGFDIGLPNAMIIRDLEVASERCQREYGCVHTDFSEKAWAHLEKLQGFTGGTANAGWISMNMTRDMAAFYRELDLRYFADGYWDWQLTTNAHEPALFYDTFNGNSLHFYPRGVAVWGFFDALGGIVVDQVRGIAEAQASFPGVRVPFLLYADWIEGNVTPVIGELVKPRK
ncbi:MAG TPA: DUF4965 domain-containing protein [Chthoniobacterales bacterium]|jgi:hypothetical protein